MQSSHAQEKSCELRTLARGQTAHIQRCTHCGSLSVHMGAVTLRFAPEALESVWNTIGEALIEHHADERAQLHGAFERRPIGDA